MAGRLYRMAKVVSANPASWGIVDANQISGFRTVATKADLYSIAACILSSSYGDGVTTGADAIGQVWHVQDVNKDFKLISWADRGKEAGWDDVDGAISANINFLNEKIAAVRKTAENNTTAIAGKANKDTVDALSQTVAAHTTSIGTINSTLNDKAEKSAVEALKKRIDSTDESLTNVTGAFDTFKSSAGKANGLATLDANKHIPLEQLGNLDTTLFEVVTDLPSTIATIKKHIYLKAAGTIGEKNNYAEYIYTGDLTSTATYDAAKWEKLGEVAAETDLTNYYKKNETYSASETNGKVTALNNADIKTITSAIEVDKDDERGGTNSLHIKLTRNDTTKVLDLKLPNATNENSGIMPKGYISKIDNAYVKLNGIEAGANKTIVDTEFKTDSTNPVQNKVIATWANKKDEDIRGALNLIDANKSKLDTIQEGANKYVHPGKTGFPKTEGLYKISFDAGGHASATTTVTNADIDKLVTVNKSINSANEHPVTSQAVINFVDAYTANFWNNKNLTALSETDVNDILNAAI